MLQKFALLLHKYQQSLAEAKTSKHELTELKGFNAIIATYVAQHSPLEGPPPRCTGGRSSGPKWPNGPCERDVMTLIGFVISMDSISSLCVILERLLQHKATNTEYLRYIEACLVPVLSAVIKIFKKRQPLWPSEPVSGFAFEVVKRFSRFVTEAIIPPQGLQGFGCRCGYCAKVAQFFHDSNNLLAMTITDDVQNHLIPLLQRSRANSAGFNWTIATKGISRVLQVMDLYYCEI